MKRAGCRGVATAVVLGLIGFGLPEALAFPRPGRTERVSVAPDGTQGNGGSFRLDFSADGRYVAFDSDARNLVPGDTNNDWDIFVRDLNTGATERVSVGAGGAQGNGTSGASAISADGRHVAFSSGASNLVPGDTNGAVDTFVHDRETGVTERVSVNSDGVQSNAASLSPGISDDGRYVVFESGASNLVPGATGGIVRIFVHDRESGTTEEVSVTSDGTPANAISATPVISGDGRYVAFQSRASNLVPGDTNGTPDIFLHDRTTRLTERVSVAGDGNQANHNSLFPDISRDGRYVAFESRASNLVPRDTNDNSDIFVHDRQAGTTERVSVASAGTDGAGGSFFASISAGGRYVTFNSSSSNLVPDDTNGATDAFVHDRQGGATDRVSVASDGTQANALSFDPGISADGRHVAFVSGATNLASVDTNERFDVFVRDRGPATGIGDLTVQKGATELVASGWATFSSAVLTSADDPSDDGSGAGPVPARDLGAEIVGASVTYRTEDEDLLLGTELAALPRGGGPGVLYRWALATAESAYEVRALAAAITATPPSAGPHFGLFECDPDCVEITRLSGGLGTTGPEVRVSVPLEALGVEEGAAVTAIRASTALGEASPGSLEGFDDVTLGDAVVPRSRVDLGIAPASVSEEDVSYTTAADLLEGRFSGSLDSSSHGSGDYRVWARACLAETCGATSSPVTLGAEPSLSPTPTPTASSTLSPSPTATPTATESASPSPSPSPGGPTPAPRARSRTERVSVTSGGAQSNSGSDGPAISGDGRYVAFDSFASNLVPDDANGLMDVFVHDWERGTVERVSVASGGMEADDRSEAPSISADGRYVAFHSWANNLVTGDTNGALDVFVHDRKTGTTERVSVASDGTEASLGAGSPDISADGRYVAFNSQSGNLVPEGTQFQVAIYVHDRQTGTTERVSVSSEGSNANGHSVSPSISGDGRFVSYYSPASNLVPGDTNECTFGPSCFDVFVHDRQTATTERVSVATDGSEGNYHSVSPTISANGRYVAFYSGASNLVTVDTNERFDLFVHDRERETTERISVASSGAEGNDFSDSYPPSLSADGRFIAFDSKANNLVPGDNNADSDVMVHDRVTKTTQRISVASDGAEGNGLSFRPAMSTDGRYVAFRSFASTLVPGDTNGAPDIFVRDRGPVVGVGALAVEEGPGELVISGWATFSGAIVASVEDPPDDGTAEAEEVGAELTGTELIYRPEQKDLLVSLRLASLPRERCTGDICERGGGAPGVLAPGVLDRRVLYGISLEIEGTRYEVRARSGSSIQIPIQINDHSSGTTISDGPHFALYRCDPDCVEEAGLEGGIGSTGPEVRISVPLQTLGAAEGMVLTGLRAFTAREGPVEDETIDEADLADATLPARSVSLGVATAGTPRQDVEFATPAQLDNGEFSGALDVSTLASGDYEVWAQACLGDLCGAASTPVTLGNGPSPTPSSSTPTVTPTATASPSPTESEPPETTTTEVSFTEGNATAGQYSDATRFEALLTDDGGDPIAEAELTFELTGAASSRSFSATTDHDGIAAVTPTLEEKPGAYQLTVRYDGDDAHAGSADTTGFVVEREDTELDLTVTGKGKNRTLTARLSDRDTPSDGIAERTIDFYADGELIGSGTTDDDGVATLGAPPGYRGGKHDFEVRFDGDAYYRGSSGGDSTR